MNLANHVPLKLIGLKVQKIIFPRSAAGPFRLAAWPFLTINKLHCLAVPAPRQVVAHASAIHFFMDFLKTDRESEPPGSAFWP